MMETIPFGTTGLQVSRLGLGTVELGMPYGLGHEAPPDDGTCLRLLHEAAASGICFVDTAAVYGRSEELVGRAFAGRSRRPLIATKVSLPPVDGSAASGGDRVRQIEASVTRSQRRLRCERLDILQIHSATTRFLDDDLIGLMQGLVDAGRVGLWGVSTYGLEAPQQALSEPGLRVLQVAYSLLDRRLEATVLPRARRQGVGVVLRSVFLKGVLSPRRHQLVPALAALGRAAAAAAAVADDLGISLEELALRFALFSGAGHVAIVGTALAHELRANLAACDAGPLPEDVLTALAAIEVGDEALLNPAAWPDPAMQIPPQPL